MAHKELGVQPKGTIGQVTVSRLSVSIAVKVLGVCVAALFIRSSIIHLFNPYYFLASVYAYEMVGKPTGIALAVVLPFIQLTIAMCLLVNFFLEAAYLLAAFLFGTFAVAQLHVIVNRLNVNCGCFGVVESRPVDYASLRTVACMFVCCVGAYIYTRSRRRQVVSEHAG